MIYGEIYEKAAALIGKENISDYRPATIEEELHGDDGIVTNFKQICVPNTVCIWLKNGDIVWYCDRSNWDEEM